MAATPELSISDCTTYNASLEDELVAYRANGVTGIGIWEFKLDEAGDDAASLERFQDSGLEATVCVPKVPGVVPDLFFHTPTDVDERREALVAAVDRFAPFQPAAILVLSGDPANWHSDASMREAVIDGVRAAADAADRHGTRIAFELLREDAGSLITTMQDAADLIEASKRDNVGLLLDTWHIWDHADLHGALRTYADLALGLQINDRSAAPRSWCDRLLPGDGEMDLVGMFRTLDEVGWDGWYDVEVFSDDGTWGDDLDGSIWKLSADEVARRSMEAFRRLWAEV